MRGAPFGNVASYASLPKKCANCSHEYLKPHSRTCPECGSKSGAIVFQTNRFWKGYEAGKIYYRGVEPNGRNMRWDGIYWRCVEHDRISGKCKDCGVGYCKHKRRIYRCKDCGVGYCEHGKREQRCPDCNGRQTCIHKKMADRCSICDPNGHTGYLLRSRIRMALLNQNIPKTSSTEEMLGCSIEKARHHIESQFTEGMSWSNAGEWHFDHRRPVSSFDLSKSEQIRMCFHYTNLQPLWALENLSKGGDFNADEFQWNWDGSKWVKKE